ncbi:MAG: hypothetical protein P4N60_16835 [Verrucomicrobiae bacterium]|nr:hypothetical protein [Verrucomicrobiae bacterium]
MLTSGMSRSENTPLKVAGKLFIRQSPAGGNGVVSPPPGRNKTVVFSAMTFHFSAVALNFNRVRIARRQ